MTVRVDQIGSLVRPEKLLDARDKFHAGAITRDQLRNVEDETILDCLKMQNDAGLQIFGDGEYRRDSWITPMSEAVDGFVEEYKVEFVNRPDGGKEKVIWHTKPVQHKLKQQRRIAEIDAAFLKENAPGPFKITLPSALCLRRSFQPGLTDKVYADERALMDEGAKIVNGEIEKLCEEGVRYIQLDEGFMPYVRDDYRQTLQQKGRDPEAELLKDIQAENVIYDTAIRHGVTTGLHICRGSRITFQKGGGAYDWLAERLFGALHVQRYLLEYDDTDRVGGYESLRFLPKDKVCVLGLVSSKDAELEGKDDLRREIDKAAKFCSIEQLAISSQCGFHGAADRNGAHISADAQKRKLELMVEVAEKVWN